MPWMTISEVTKAFQVSTRMLRYYDEIGLLHSSRKDDYAYRVYDETAVKRLQQILTLRKLRIPLKKIAQIFESREQKQIVEVFWESLKDVDQEIEAMQTIRDILRVFLARLKASTKAEPLNLLEDADVIRIMELVSQSQSQTTLKEENSMEKLNQANELLSTLTNVRILYLPPVTVAASHYFGENPEDHAGKALDDFILSSKLAQIKPDLRVIGFNNPSPAGEEPYGYEFWVTIPDDFQVPAPLVKKQFPGGLYAAHCIKMGDFQEWPLLGHWVDNNPDYAYDPREPLGMGGCLEEHLNAYSFYMGEEKDRRFIQLDLLSPIKKK